MNFTPQQNLAITSEGKNIIVSAGAGSGKTAVLTARVIRKLNDGVDIDRLLVLTFTNEAAREMKNRIREAIIKNNLTKQLSLLDSAYITTFDSFALSFVKKYHYLLNIPKDISIVDSGLIKIYIHKLIDKVFDLRYGDSKFDKMIDQYCLKDDKLLKEFIYNIYDNFSLLIDPDEHIDGYIDKYYNEEFINSLIKNYEDIIKKKIIELENLYQRLISYAPDSLISKLDSYFSPLFNGNSYQEYRLFLTMPSVQFRGISEDGSVIKDSIKELIKEITLLLRYDSCTDIYNKYLLSRDNTEVIIDIVRDVNDKLWQYKLENKVFEFNDISRMAIRIVRDNKDIAKEVKEYFNEIMVDEYQDTSSLQEEFIKYISNNNVYMVGDIKQSIYRFRNANPYIFKTKYDLYSNTSEGIKIDLVENFRSREEVLHNINEIFNLVMDDTLGSADYLTSHNMVFGNTNYTYENAGYNYQLEVFNYQYDRGDKNSREEKELFIVAKDIKDKIDNKYQVFDKKTNKLRDIKYSDICIITDRNRHLALYRKILEFNEIPSLIYMNEKLSSDKVFLVIKNLIALVYYVKNKEYNSEFKYVFTSVARSFLFEYSDDEIYQIHENNSFYSDQIFLKCLNIDIELPIFDIINNIIFEFNVYDKLTKLPSINNNIVIINSIVNVASNLSYQGYSLLDFSEYLSSTLEYDIPIEYKINQLGSNAVKIMNIHKSKGLEFSICYFVGMANKFSFDDISGNYLVSNKYGIILPEICDGKLTDSFVKTLYANDFYFEEVSEKIRLFYVALTRTREKMIIVASIDTDTNNDYNSLVPDYVRIKYRSFLDILNSLTPVRKYLVGTSAKVDDDYKNVRIKDIDVISNTVIKNHELKIDYNIVNDNHYSKNTKLIDSDMARKLEYGTDIHKTMEYTNNNKLFSKLPKNYLNIYHEFEFIDTINNNNYHGIIDLMVEYDTIIYIIDYKLKDISDLEYKKQLSGYANYIKKITNKEIKTFLYSIMDDELREVTNE